MKNGQKNVTTKTEELIQIADQSQMCVYQTCSLQINAERVCGEGERKSLER